MTELAIDMAGVSGSVALRFGQDLDQILVRDLVSGPGRGEVVFGLLEELFSEADVEARSLTSVLTTVGPGSFTGVRVGIALAKGLALASGAELFGVSRTLLIGRAASLEGQPAGGVCLQETCFASLINAGRGGVFVQSFSNVAGSFRARSDPQLLAFEEVAAFASDHDLSALVGAEPLDPLVEAGFCLPPDLPFVALPVSAIDLWAIEAPFLLGAREVAPLYLRAPDAKPQAGASLLRRHS